MMKPILVALALLVASALIHVSLLILVLDAVAWVLRRVRRRTRRLRQAALICAVLGVVVASHLAQVWLWARAMMSLGLVEDFGRALRISMGFYSSVGPGPVALPPPWELLGPFEALTGLLMLGMSTAVVFAVVHRLLQARLEHVAPTLLDDLP